MRKFTKRFLAVSLALFTLLMGGCSMLKKNPVELYQLAPEPNSLMQSYVIKTSDNKLIVIDGGIDGEGLDAAPYLPAALRAIAGVEESEYFEVEAWFLSHAHGDHYYELAKMLREYNADSNYKINNLYFDFPANVSSGVLWELQEGLNNYAKTNNIEVKSGSFYDDLNGAVVNANSVEEGLEFEIDDIRIEVLQTWHDSDGPDTNSNSQVLRFWVDDQSILFLGDLGPAGEERLLSGKYKDSLESDIVQMAHHGQRGVSETAYKAFNAKVHLWPTPLWVWFNVGNEYQIDEVRQWLYGETFYTADEYNMVACLYDAYPEDSTSVEDWNEVKDGMKITLPYEPEAK